MRPRLWSPQRGRTDPVCPPTYVPPTSACPPVHALGAPRPAPSSSHATWPLPTPLRPPHASRPLTAHLHPLHHVTAPTDASIFGCVHTRIVTETHGRTLYKLVPPFRRAFHTIVCTIDAPNTSWCECSPDGRFLLTATLSSRLRVDNGIKIWNCTGPVHVQMIEELYQVHSSVLCIVAHR